MYNAEKLTSIDLGRQGENLARTVEIDVSEMLERWPDAAITLLVKRKHDAEPYIADTTVDNGVLSWPITAAETADAGDGKLEIRATCGEVIAKSATGSFRVTASLTGSGTEPPESAQGWVDKVIAAGAGVEQDASQASKAADRAEAAAETAENSIAQIQSAAETATAMAAEAEDSAEAASAASTEAVGSARAAREAQTAAEEAKTSAADSASLAEQAKDAAEAAQKAAAEQAAFAEESARAADTGAQEAQTSANAAASSEQAAQTAAMQAAREAQAASAAQSEAEKAFDSAKSSAEASAESAAAARDSADAAAEGKQAASDASTEALERLNAAEAARDAAVVAQEAAEDSAALAAQSAVEAGEAAQVALGILDDAVTATDSTWSSQRIADMLCTPFEVSGNPVVCHPIEGSPLEVTASWKPKQHFDWVQREAESSQVATTGAQMLEPTDSIGSADDIEIIANGDGSYTYISTNTTVGALRFFGVTSITLKAGVSYTLSTDKALDVDIRIAGGGRIVAGKTSVTFAPSTDTLVDHVAIDRPKGHSGTNTVKVMLCEGTTAKPWEPYTGGQAAPCPDYPQEIADSLPAGDYYVPCSMGGYWKVSLDAVMGGVPGYADAVEIDAYTGRYRLVRRTAVLVLDGSESWSIGGKFLEDGSDWYYSNAIKLSDALDSAGTPLICDHYPMGNISNNSTGNGIAIIWRNVRVRWGEEGTVEDWKTQLAASPVTVRYALAEPVVVTGQAEKVVTTTGMAALSASSMGLTVADPDHPCAITGKDSVEITRCGRNLFDFSSAIPDINTSDGVTAEKMPDGKIHVYGTSTSSAWVNIVAKYMVSAEAPVFPAGTYCTGKKFTVGMEDIGNKSGVFTIDRPSRMVRFYSAVRAGETVDYYAVPMLVAGTVCPDSCEPYRGGKYGFTLPQTMYGGELNAATGNGITAVCGVALDGSEGWSESTIEGRVYFQCALSSNSNRQPNTASSVDAAKRIQRCSHFTVGNPWASDVDDCFWVFSTPTLQYPSLRMRSTSNFASVEELRSYLATEKAAGTPVTIVYETIASEAFSAEEAFSLPALTGINTLYTDTDSLTVSGRTDPLYTLDSITERLAALEAAAIEGSNV